MSEVFKFLVAMFFVLMIVVGLGSISFIITEPWHANFSKISEIINKGLYAFGVLFLFSAGVQKSKGDTLGSIWSLLAALVMILSSGGF